MAEFCEYADGKETCELYDFDKVPELKALTPAYKVEICLVKEKSDSLCPFKKLKKKLGSEKK